MEFRVGDKVRYELSWWGKPRWVGNRDRGGSGHWEDGIVDSVDDKELVVKGKTGRSIWPLEKHRHYDFLQWSWAGYLQLMVDTSKRKGERKCVCGAEKVYGSNATHSDWCDKYDG